MEQTCLRENPPGALGVQKQQNYEKSLGGRIQECGVKCGDGDLHDESAKRKETETCDVRSQYQQQQEEDGQKEQPEEELDPRIQVT